MMKNAIPQWPAELLLPDGVELSTAGALCTECNELMEDHACPPPQTDEPSDRRNGSVNHRNVIPFQRS
jgi:hypothetical protein